MFMATMSFPLFSAREEKNGCYAYKLSKPKRLRKALKAKNKPSPVFWLPKFPRLRWCSSPTSEMKVAKR